MNIKEMIVRQIADSMPDIPDSTPVGDVMKYAEDVAAAAETAAEDHLKRQEQEESTS